MYLILAVIVLFILFKLFAYYVENQCICCGKLILSKPVYISAMGKKKKICFSCYINIEFNGLKKGTDYLGDDFYLIDKDGNKIIYDLEKSCVFCKETLLEDKYQMSVFGNKRNVCPNCNERLKKIRSKMGEHVFKDDIFLIDENGLRINE